MFDDADQLKAEIRGKAPDDFFNDHLVGGHSKHFGVDKLAHFCAVFSENFDTEIKAEEVSMVGSAKLGFALHDKRKPGLILKAYRPFRAASDIDLTICNPTLFRKIWYELTAHACLQNYMPWNPDKLSDYLMYGWLRPDKFPNGQSLTHCDQWYRTVGQIKRDRANGHPAVSVALFYSHEQLKRYQIRSVRAAKARLEVA